VEEEDFELGLQGVVVLGGLAGGGLERDGEVAGVGGLLAGREAEDVGGLVLVAELLVEALDVCVGGEEDFDLAGQADEGAGAVEETRESGLAGGGEERTWRVDGDHRGQSAGIASVNDGNAMLLQFTDNIF